MRRAFLFSEKPHEKSQSGADQKASDDWKVKAGVAAAYVNVARELAEPSATKARPDQKSNRGDDQSYDEQQFPEFHREIISRQKISGRCGRHSDSRKNDTEGGSFTAP